MPLPLFFILGAVVGIVLAVTVLSLVRRTSNRAAQAKVVSVQASPVVEHARALFVWPPEITGERAPAPASPASPVEAALPAPVAPSPRAFAPTARAVVVAIRPPATRGTTKAPPAEKREQALPENLLAAGL